MSTDKTKPVLHRACVFTPSNLDIGQDSADVVFAIDLPNGTKTTGAVTLVKDKINNTWVPCGDSPEHWVDWMLLRILYDAAGNRDTMKSWLGDIAADAAQEIVEDLE